MRRYVIMLIALYVLGVAAAGPVLLVGCQSHGNTEDFLPGGSTQDIGLCFVYAGNWYMDSGVIVAHEKTGANTPSNVMYISSISYPGGEFDLYLIQGTDEDEAIAAKVGTGGGYLYFKYEKVYGQEEPADFVYEGSHYAETGEIVGMERVASATGTPEHLTYLNSVIYQGTTYEVYSIHIQGEDRSQEIALKTAKAGKTVGFYYYYFTYERQ